MKKWYLSKTLWVNIVAVLVVVAEYLIAEKIYMPEVHAIVIAVLNLVLRVITKQKLTK